VERRAGLHHRCIHDKGALRAIHYHQHRHQVRHRRLQLPNHPRQRFWLNLLRAASVPIGCGQVQWPRMELVGGVRVLPPHSQLQEALSRNLLNDRLPRQLC
jgi:hypothetical protein